MSFLSSSQPTKKQRLQWLQVQPEHVAPLVNSHDCKKHDTTAVLICKFPLAFRPHMQENILDPHCIDWGQQHSFTAARYHAPCPVPLLVCTTVSGLKLDSVGTELIVKVSDFAYMATAFLLTPYQQVQCNSTFSYHNFHLLTSLQLMSSECGA